MSALYLTESDVQSLVDMPTTIDVVREAFVKLAAGEAMDVPRQRAKAPGIVLHTMSAAAPYLGVIGWKAYTTSRQGARFQVALYEQASGVMLAWIEADWLGRLRTGATTGVAADCLAPLEVHEMGLLGTGKQAETQLTAVCCVRPIREAFVYGRDAERRLRFAERMSQQLGIQVTPVDRPQEAAEELPLVVTATNSPEPVFDGRAVEEGAFVAAVGSNALNRAELDVDLIRRADRIVCDSVAGCRNEAGDFVAALERGFFDWNKAVDLAQVVSGQTAGGGLKNGITLFKSVGMAIEDVALGAKLLELARAKGVGRLLELSSGPLP